MVARKKKVIPKTQEELKRSVDTPIVDALPAVIRPTNDDRDTLPMTSTATGMLRHQLRGLMHLVPAVLERAMRAVLDDDVTPTGTQWKAALTAAATVMRATGVAQPPPKELPPDSWELRVGVLRSRSGESVPPEIARGLSRFMEVSDADISSPWEEVQTPSDSWTGEEPSAENGTILDASYSPA